MSGRSTIDPVRGWSQRIWWPLLVGLGGLFLDLLTRDLASTLLAGRGPVDLGFGLRLVHRTSQGALLGEGHGLVALVGLSILGWLVPYRRARSWAVVLMAAGTVGNLLERAWRAHVVEFLQVGPGDWATPAFNLADLEVTIGLVVVLVALCVWGVGIVRAGIGEERDERA